MDGLSCCAFAASMASEMAARSCPSTSCTKKLNAFHLSTMGSSPLMDSTGPSNCIRLLSNSTMRLSSFLDPANILASQICPSWLSPSPMKQYIVAGLRSILAAIAIPTAAESPCPSEPAVMSMPGVLFMSQWEGRLVPLRLRVDIQSLGKYPRSQSTEYIAGPACPLDIITRSRSCFLGSLGSTFALS